MRGLSTLSSESSLCTLTSPSRLVNRIISVFKGPHSYQRHRDSQTSSRAAYPPEKPYYHVPTHAASSHIRTTTTQRMRDIEMDIQEQHELDERLGRDSRIGPIRVDGRGR